MGTYEAKEGQLRELVGQIQTTAKEIQINKQGSLIFGIDQVETLIKLAFSDQELLDKLKKEGLMFPPNPQQDFKFQIVEGDPVLEMDTTDPHNPVAKFRVEKPKIEVAVPKVYVPDQTREFNSLELQIANHPRALSDLMLTAANISPDISTRELAPQAPLIPSGCETLQTTVMTVFGGNYLMRPLYNVLVPIMAVNAGRGSQVLGMEARLVTDGAKLTFYKDKYTYTQAGFINIPQIKGYKAT
ncbi:hypothetical protein A2872_00900 [Candidatus Gottesmanbacteria bacterium RIFCSPHIGHO2_01_FULL_42_12]|uniref:Uncharacterized protein n=1 Tax=Candidatus Gottesmanbacteria bacterium RIFCSPHIGHO2_01_FULL_42_12 TaxID=1798377 RepID=A0A1F5Z332_9BACT|nr:MAG: hypothetical protein A2872_00900 [Candidatus Gottesmanbacteria bacterium RIFCSPHIGHO2_01_FULL_42_12]